MKVGAISSWSIKIFLVLRQQLLDTLNSKLDMYLP
jgi:hypothetical protein